VNNYKEMIEDNEWQSKEKKKELETAKAELEKLNVAWREHQAEITRLNTELEAANEAHRETTIALNANRANQTLLEREITGLDQTATEMKREQAIQELESKQADFWDVVEARMALLIDELNSGLTGFDDDPKDAKEIVAQLKENEGGVNFGEPWITIRQHRQFYQQSIRKICEKRVDGKAISPDEKQARINLIDRMLREQALVVYWS
jgi:chromosome segregation ATPase